VELNKAYRIFWLDLPWIWAGFGLTRPKRDPGGK
jgi:hypothetical protein